MGQQGIDIDCRVGQHAIDLLDRMFGVQSTRQRQALPDQRDRHRGGVDRSQRGAGQRKDALGMQAVTEQRFQVALDAFERDLLAG